MFGDISIEKIILNFFSKNYSQITNSVNFIDFKKMLFYIIMISMELMFI